MQIFQQRWRAAPVFLIAPAYKVDGLALTEVKMHAGERAAVLSTLTDLVAQRSIKDDVSPSIDFKSEPAVRIKDQVHSTRGNSECQLNANASDQSSRPFKKGKVEVALALHEIIDIDSD